MHVKPATKVLLSVMFDSTYSFTVFVGSSTRFHIHHFCAKYKANLLDITVGFCVYETHMANVKATNLTCLRFRTADEANNSGGCS